MLLLLLFVATRTYPTRACPNPRLFLSSAVFEYGVYGRAESKRISMRLVARAHTYARTPKQAAMTATADTGEAGSKKRNRGGGAFSRGCARTRK